MRGWVVRRRKREGIYVYIQPIHFIVQQKLTQHCKAILSQLKKKKKRCVEPDILEYEVKWALGSITAKLVDVME